MSDAPPATADEADAALMHKQDARAPSLDGYAQTYQAALSLRAYLDQYEEQVDAAADSVRVPNLCAEVDRFLGDLREHVAEEHPVAVRETLAFDRAPDL